MQVGSFIMTIPPMPPTPVEPPVPMPPMPVVIPVPVSVPGAPPTPGDVTVEPSVVVLGPVIGDPVVWGPMLPGPGLPPAAPAMITLPDGCDEQAAYARPTTRNKRTT